MSHAAGQAHLDDHAVVSLGEDGGVVIDIRHINVHGRCADSGWTAVVRSLNGECVTRNLLGKKHTEGECTFILQPVHGV